MFSPLFISCVVVLEGCYIRVSHTNSAACKRSDQYLVENDIRKSQMKFMKYILVVNKKSSNIAVMSELGRYPMYFFHYFVTVKI